MYVERLVLNEFRAIASSDIVFIHPMSPQTARRELPNINLLVGTNGGGKSTIRVTDSGGFRSQPQIHA
ncbi:MAG TPA: hypothetical protein VIW94_05145 [Acidimicrobiia bacterium]